MDFASMLKPGLGLVDAKKNLARHGSAARTDNSDACRGAGTVTDDLGEKTNDDTARSEMNFEEATHEPSEEEDEAEESADDDQDGAASREMEIEDSGSADDNEEDSDEDLDDSSGPAVYKGFFRLENEQYVPATDYLGDNWIRHIRDLYDVEPIQVPQNMTVIPHDYQLKAAAQADWLCRSRFKGVLLGDPMGLGKTLTAILTMWMVKDEPGFSMVVAPKTLCQQWIQAIQAALQEGHGLTTYLFEGSSSITAHELLALGVDVVVVSYDQVEVAQRALRTFPQQLDAYQSDNTGLVRLPKRPAAALHSEFWKHINLPIKRLVLDEAQVINKRDSVRHNAVKALYYKAVIQLSGMLAHNKWHDFSGYVDLLSGHPFPTHRDFMKAFSTYGYDGELGIDLKGTRLLQRFLQAVTIARPAGILALKQCRRFDVQFSLQSEKLANEIKLCTKKFSKGGDDSDEESHRDDGEGDEEMDDEEVDDEEMDDEEVDDEEMDEEEVDGEDGDDEKCGDEECISLLGETDIGHSSKGFGMLVKARLWSIHPILLDESGPDNDGVAADAEAEANGEDNDNDNGGTLTAKEQRSQWLSRLQGLSTDELYRGSDRLRQFVRVHHDLRLMFPDRKIVVFTQFLRFLVIAAEVLKRELNVHPLRYDGTVPMDKRPAIQAAFEAAHPKIPLFLTAGAGSFGLNIACASIVIQTEVWWNSNTEKQAVCRAWRQGQSREVVYIRLIATDSEIDAMMLRVQKRKDNVNSGIMQPILRHPDQGPDIRPIFEPLVLSPMDWD